MIQSSTSSYAQCQEKSKPVMNARFSTTQVCIFWGIFGWMLANECGWYRDIYIDTQITMSTMVRRTNYPKLICFHNETNALQ